MKSTLYGIRLNYGRLALSGGSYALYFRHKDAVKFRNELIPHLCYKGKIVRVSVEWETAR